jgi:hypothetical protein
VVTRKNVIAFSWSDGVSDGGAVILDYSVSYDQSTNNYVTLATGITTKSFTTTVTLTSGVVYKFKVIARNSVGYSAESEEVAILAA